VGDVIEQFWENAWAPPHSYYPWKEEVHMGAPLGTLKLCLLEVLRSAAQFTSSNDKGSVFVFFALGFGEARRGN
jgi:hypothetical protein